MLPFRAPRFGLEFRDRGAGLGVLALRRFN